MVWTKFLFDQDKASGDLTPDAKRQIDEYVTRVFREHVRSDSVSDVYIQNRFELNHIVIGYLVQELASVEFRTRTGIFSRHAI